MRNFTLEWIGKWPGIGSLTLAFLFGRKLLLFLLVCLFSVLSSLEGGLRAQNFPITAVVQVTQFSPYVEAYDDPGKVIITLLSTDERPEYQAILRVSLSGPGFSMRTREDFIPFPITLRRNMPLVLTGAQLRDYFDPANLVFGGQNLAAFQAGGGVLPEGPVSLCVEVFDFNRFFDPPVSNTACANGLLLLQRPPILIEPLGQVNLSLPQQVRFQWQPQHIGIVARYRLEVYEDVMPGMGDNLIIAATQPMLETTVSVPFYMMSNAAQLLQEHTRYLVRVRAEDILGQAAFLNDGWSDITDFYTGEAVDGVGDDVACLAPQAFTHSFGEAGTQLFNWTANSQAVAWVLYNNQGDTVSLDNSTFSYEVNGLLANQVYTYTLCNLCEDGTSACSSVSFTSPEGEEGVNCGPALVVNQTVVSNEGLRVSWQPIPEASSFVLRWAIRPLSQPRRGQGINRGRNEQIPEQLGGEGVVSTGDQGEVVIAAGRYEALVEGLQAQRTYDFSLCKRCPEEGEVCTSWVLPFVGLQDDCLTNLELVRTDSTATSLSLSWVFNAQEQSADGFFTLIWQLSDESEVADSARLAYSQQAYTITDLLPDRTYSLRLCADCVADNTVCLDLPPIGCAAAYTPLLADLGLREALIHWEVAVGETNRAVELRYKRIAESEWQIASETRIHGFDLAALEIEADQAIAILALSPQATYVVQLRSSCSDGNWSDWSAPLTFCLSCAVTAAPRLVAVSDRTANVMGIAQSNANYYSFEYRRVGEEAWIISEEAAQPLLALEDLLASTPYELRMRYWCNRGVWSDYSPVLEFTTLAVCGLPIVGAVDPLLANSAGLNWQQGENAQTTLIRYRLQPLFPVWNGGTWQRLSSENETQLLADLRGGATYEFQLQSDCGDNQSDWTDQEIFTLQCAAPNLLSAADVTYNSARLSWSQYAESAVGFEVAFKKTADTTWTVKSTLFPFLQLQELADLTYYDVKVATRCGSGSLSDYSPSIQFFTPVKCLAVEQLEVSDLSPFTAQVDWELSGNMLLWQLRLKDRKFTGAEAASSADLLLGDGESPADQGSSRNNNAPSDPYREWEVFTVSEPSKLLEQLLPDNPYTLVVRAQCVGGAWTDYSEELDFRTLSDCQAPRALLVDQIYQNTARTNWEQANRFGKEYLVMIESLLPVARGNGAAQIQIGMEGNNVGRNPGMGASSGYAIYRDSILTNARSAVFEGLLPDTEYRFKVKTRCDNFGWTDYSEWLVFRTDICSPPADIVEESIDNATMRISWTGDNGAANNYEIKYRLAEEAGAAWVSQTTDYPFVELSPLLTNQLYEYEVAELCQGGTGRMAAALDTFLMKKPSLNNGLYACGLETEVDLSNQTPLSQLQVGDSIVVFDFVVVITSVSGGSGYFSGTGEIQMPYFNRAKFAFTFDNIFVNDDYRMVGGYIEATGFGVEVLPPWADSLLGSVLGILEAVVEEIDDRINETLNELIELGESINLPTELQDQLQEVADCFANATTEEERQVCSALLDELIADIEAFIEELYNGDFQVTFSPAPNQQYGFDKKGENDPIEWYETRQIAGEEYVLAYKSAKRLHGEENVLATIMVEEGSPYSLDSVKFTQLTATPLPFSRQGNDANITFVGQDREAYFLAAEQITAGEASNYIAGLLNVVTYDEISLNVVLVPLSSTAATGVDATAIQNTVADIYKQALVKPTITLADVFTPPSASLRLENVSSSILANYTSQMKSIRSAYQDAGLVQENTYYLFLVDDYDSTNRQGFMPRGRKFGFIYMGNAGSGDALARVIAHELGHGAFVLEHTYEAYPDLLPEQATNNLMDKGSGTRLYKWQWDLIHNPVSPPWLEGDEEGESVTISDLSILDDFRNDVDKSLTFLTPAGQVITLPENTESITFNSGDNLQKVEGSCVEGFKIFAFGTLRSFRINGENFVTCYSCSTTSFVAYTTFDSNPGCGTPYIDALSKNVIQDDVAGISKAIVGFPCFQNGKIIFKIGQVNATAGAGVGDPAGYVGSGLNKDFDWLAGQYNSITTEKSVENPNFSPPLDVKIIKFLNAVASDASCGSQAALYIFAHIHQLNANLDFFEACGFDLLAQQEIDAQEIFEKTKRNYRRAAARDEFGISTPIQYLGPSPSFNSAEIAAWKQADLSVYQAIDQLRATMWSDGYWDALDETKIADAQKVLNDFYSYREDACVFTNLKIEHRIKALKLLNNLTLTESNFFDVHFSPLVLGGILPIILPYSEDDEEHLYNAILGSTPTDDFAQILDFYKGENENYADFFSVANKMLDFMGDEGYARFAEILTRMVLATKGQPELTITPVDPSEFNHTYFPTNIFCDIAGQETPEELNYVKSFYAGTDYYFSHDYEASFANNKINVSGAFSFFQMTSEYGGGLIEIEDYTITGNPFDYVAIKIDDALRITGAGATVFDAESGVLIVPYCWAHLIYDRLDDAEVQLGIRMAGNALSLFLVPFSGGASLGLRTLIYVEAAYSLADGYVASDAYEWAHTGSGNLSQTFHNVWNTTGLVIGAANLAGVISIPAYANRVTKVNLSKLKETYDQIKRSPFYSEADLNELRLKFGQSYDEFVDFRNGLTPNNLPPGWVLSQADLDFFDSFIAQFARERDFLEFYARYAPKPWPSGGNQLLSTIDLADDAATGAYQLILKMEGPNGAVLPMGGVVKSSELPFTPANWLPPGGGSSSVIQVGMLDDITFFTSQGVKTTGKLAVYLDPTNPTQVFCKIINLLDDDAIWSVVQKIVQARLGEAFDLVTSLSSNPIYATLQEQHSTLMQQYRIGVINYADFTTSLNQIRLQLINELITVVPAGRPGVSQSVINRVVSKIIEANTGSAIQDVFTATNNLNVYISSIALHGRYSTVKHHDLQGILSYSQSSLIYNQINDGLLGLLPSSNAGAGGLTNIELQVLIGQFNIGALDNALGDGAAFISSPVFYSINSQAVAIMADYIAGAVSSLDLVLSRNQLVKQFIDNIPLTPTGTGGWTQEAIQTVVGYIASGNTEQAIQSAFDVIDDLDTYKVFLQINSRLEGLKTYNRRGVISGPDYNSVFNQINEAILLSLPSSTSGMAPPVTLSKVIDAIKWGDLDNAIPGAIQLGSSPALAIQYADLINEKVLGIISYSQFVNTRKQIIEDLVNSLSPVPTGGNGFTTAVVQNIQNAIADADIDEAFTLAFNANIDPAIYKTLIKIKGRHLLITRDNMRGIGAYDVISGEQSDIAAVFLRTLPSGFNWSILNWTPNTVHIEIRDFIDGLIAQGKANVGAWNDIGSYYPIYYVTSPSATPVEVGKLMSSGGNGVFELESQVNASDHLLFFTQSGKIAIVEQLGSGIIKLKACDYAASSCNLLLEIEFGFVGNQIEKIHEVISSTQFPAFIADLQPNGNLVNFFRNSSSLTILESRLRAWDRLHSAGKAAAAKNISCLQLFSRLEIDGLPALSSNLLNNLDDAKLIEFSGDFSETILETLQRMDNDVSIFNYWKVHKQEFLTPYVTNTGNIPSVATVAASFQGNPEIIALINAVDAAPLPSNNQFVMAGCHHPSLPNTYQIKYNFTSASSEYQAFLNSCHPLLKDRIKYMDMIRNDFVSDPPGTAHVRLINIDDLEKLTFAGEAGRHAELQSLSETLYRIEQAENMAPGTFPKSRLSEVSIFVKNKNGNVMQRCPCCFHGSHDRNVNMVNLPGND